MPNYVYHALDAQQNRTHGSAFAANRQELNQILSARNLVLTRARRQFWGRKKLPLPLLADFFDNLAQLLAAGIGAQSALVHIGQSSRGALKNLTAALGDAIEGGQTLASACAQSGVFSQSHIHILKAGELSGKLPAVLGDLSRDLAYQHHNRQQLRAALSYPLFALIVVLAVAAFLLIYLVPQLQPFLAQTQTQMPFYSAALIAVAGFLQKYLLAILLIWAALILLWVLLAANSPKMRYWQDFLQLKLPIVGNIFRQLQLAAFSQNMALMYGAGVSLLESLRILPSTLSNRYLGAQLHRAAAQIEAGASLSHSFDSQKIFNPIASSMLHIGEQSGSLEASLHKISQSYARAADVQLEWLKQLLNPILTVFLGLLLLWIMAATLLPIYQAIGEVR